METKRYTIDPKLADEVVWLELSETEPCDETDISQCAMAASRSRHGLSVWSWQRWLPLNASLQGVVAEVLSQSVSAGLTELDAVDLTAMAIRSTRVRWGLEHVVQSILQGRRLERSFRETKLPFSNGLIEALRVGCERNVLASELHSFAVRMKKDVRRRTIRHLGRSAFAIRFAGALERLLKDHGLTLSVIEDAGRIAAESNSLDLKKVAELSTDLQNGLSLTQAVHRLPKDFDKLFCRLLDTASSREMLRTNLAMLANDQPG